MHADVDVAGQQRPLDFFRKNAARADLFDRPRSLDVAASRNFDDFDSLTKLPKSLSNPLRLPASELAAACADSQRAVASMLYRCHWIKSSGPLCTRVHPKQVSGMFYAANRDTLRFIALCLVK
jgi:hypothetical protein